MSGSISLSLSQQFDSLGNPLAGGKLYTYAAGTTTPQSAFQDTGLVQALSNPVLLDAAGRIPQLFFADGNIKILLTDVHGVTQLAADNILVIGPSAAGGGGATVDPTTVLQTGWIQPIYGTGNVTGFVRANGRTMGNASSGATERANVDTSALFTFLYNADTNLAVSGGRGASAAVDYAANKTITLPDFRGRALAGLADMGNSASTILDSVTFTAGTSITLGASLGAARRTLAITNIPAHDHDVFLNDPGHLHSNAAGGGGSNENGGAVGQAAPLNNVPGSTGSSTTGITVRSASGGGGTVNKTASTGSTTAFDAVSPYALITIYLKL